MTRTARAILLTSVLLVGLLSLLSRPLPAQDRQPGLVAEVYRFKTVEYLPEHVDVLENGIDVRFTSKFDPDAASSVRNFLMKIWNVKWSEEYGAPNCKVSAPDRKGRDQIDVTRAELLEDGRTVRLTIPKLKQCTNYRLRFRLQPEDGTRIQTNKIHGTINDEQ